LKQKVAQKDNISINLRNFTAFNFNKQRYLVTNKMHSNDILSVVQLQTMAIWQYGNSSGRAREDQSFVLKI
jgi:hypothetical protein